MDPEKVALYDGFAEVAKALANSTRLMIIDLLAQSERGVEELAAELDAKVSNVSAQLQVLKASGIVKSKREGTHILYRLSDPSVQEVFEKVLEFGWGFNQEVHSAASAYLGAVSSLETLSLTELRKRLETGDVFLIDVRPEREYLAGHVVGAHSIPLAKLEARIHELPLGVEIVAYCRGPFCALAPRAQRLLVSYGIKAKVLEIGFPQLRKSELVSQQ